MRSSEGGGESKNLRATRPCPVPLPFHRARNLRRSQTDAESKLWSQLRAHRLRSFKFRRQFPIREFIVDFCCRERRIVIELDGGQHGEPEGAASDARRTLALEAWGYRVIRFWNNEVLQNIDGVAEAIYEALGEESP
jgi:very-short-patch-repair endonuclease